MFFLVLVGVPCYSFHGGWLQAQSAQGQSETFQRQHSCSTQPRTHWVLAHLLVVCCNNCSTFCCLVIEEFWSNLGSKSKVACFTLFGASWSDAQLPRNRRPVGSRVPTLHRGGSSALGTDWKLCEAEGAVRGRNCLTPKYLTEGSGDQGLFFFYFSETYGTVVGCWCDEYHCFFFKCYFCCPWGENAYYFAHNRHFEIPQDAKIISGPGLVTGGSPEKIQELVDSLWVGWIDLMVTNIHQKNIKTWLILRFEVGCINCDSLWFVLHSVQFEAVSVPFVW